MSFVNRSKQRKDNSSVTPVKGKKQQDYDTHRMYPNAAMVEKASTTIHVLPPAIREF